jgi:hypothetical protein
MTDLSLALYISYCELEELAFKPCARVYMLFYSPGGEAEKAGLSANQSY